jgi:hypothetical protein
MVGIVAILLLGSLTWSAVGALFNAVSSITSSISVERPTPVTLAGIVGTPTSVSTTASTPGTTSTPGPRTTEAPLLGGRPVNDTSATMQGTPDPNTDATAERTPPATLAPTTTSRASATATAAATAATTPTPAAAGRAPWVLLPLPAPDTRIAPGPVTVEARGRGDATITAIRLELDGAALPVSLEQRSESTWRGSATTRVAAGKHNVRAVVVDEQNRSGSFRWTFEAGP